MLDGVKLDDHNSCPNEKTLTFEVQSVFVSSFSTVADRYRERVPGLIMACGVFSLCSEFTLYG